MIELFIELFYRLFDFLFTITPIFILLGCFVSGLFNKFI